MPNERASFRGPFFLDFFFLDPKARDPPDPTNHPCAPDQSKKKRGMERTVPDIVEPTTCFAWVDRRPCADQGFGAPYDDGHTKRRRLAGVYAPRTTLASLPAEMRMAILLCLDRAVDYVSCVTATPLFREACPPSMWIRHRARLYADEPDRVFASDECVAVVREVWARWGALSLAARGDAHTDGLCGQPQLWNPHCNCWEYRALKEALERDRRSTVAFLCDTVLDVHKRLWHTMDQRGRGRDSGAESAVDPMNHNTADSQHTTDDQVESSSREPAPARRPRHRDMAKSVAAGALTSFRPDDALFLLAMLGHSAGSPTAAADHVERRAARWIMNLTLDDARSIVRAVSADRRKSMLDAIACDAITYGRCDLGLLAHDEGASDRLQDMLCEVVGDVQAVDCFTLLWDRAIAGGHAPEILWERVVDALPSFMFTLYPVVIRAILAVCPPLANKGLLCARAIRHGNPSSVNVACGLGAGDFDCPEVRAAIADACDADNVAIVSHVVRNAPRIDPRILLARTCQRRSPRVASFLRGMAKLEGDAERQFS
nr:hypothetical protein [Pandoravirus massiliensis]